MEILKKLFLVLVVSQFNTPPIACSCNWRLGGRATNQSNGSLGKSSSSFLRSITKPETISYASIPIIFV